MEKKLRELFDFQKFEKNADLQAVIDKVHARHSALELSDDDVSFVAAAGMPETAIKRKRLGEEEK